MATRISIKQRYNVILDTLKHRTPSVDTELTYTNTFELLVCVVLSAQCTDKRVNLVTPALFAAYPTAEAMAKATSDDILSYIHSVSYPNSKAKYLVGLSQMIANEYGGEVPDTIEVLTRLPGVGRKTANVIQALAFGKPAIAVDTHVFRVSHRLGLVSPSDTTPFKVEQTLTKHIAEDERANAHFWLLYHGRYTCKAVRPQCADCDLTELCVYLRTKENGESIAALKEKV